MMSERLNLAKQLLTEDGVIFVSIDDNEQAYLKVLMDEIFGEENFICNFIWNKLNSQNDAAFIQSNHEYILFYAKNKSIFTLNKTKINEIISRNQSLKMGGIDGYLHKRKKMGQTIYYHPITKDIKILMDYNPDDVKEDSTFSIYKDNIELIKKGYFIIRPSLKNGKLGRWRLGLEKMNQKINDLVIKFNNSIYKVFEKIEKTEKNNKYSSILNEDINSYFFSVINTLELEDKIINIRSGNGAKELTELNLNFPYPKNIVLLKYLINLHPNKNTRILDFFAGSGTTGHAVLELNKEDNGNRTFTLVTNNENNIFTNTTYERLYRIIKGKSTKNETNFKWIEKNQPFLSTPLDVYDIEYFNISIDAKENLDNVIEVYKQSLIDFTNKTISLTEEQILFTLNKLKSLKK
ncbi:type III restriction-modification system: methylase [Mesomycoplasma neurolyticum]|uniref:Type III restriction-modification system: methylase n=2 Tax=Mesomycoplasma neurolyticum TaxID=2120 RepID=A0A449A5A2_9BACT|nr:type III restriction-modification system: methylase [Mesomycoplasma neurolyticum]